MNTPRNLIVLALAAGLGLLAVATWLPAVEAPSLGAPNEVPLASLAATAAVGMPAPAVSMVVAAPSESRQVAVQLIAQLPPGALAVAVEAPLDHGLGIPLVLTCTSEHGVTERVLELATDAQAQATVLRQFLQPRGNGGVLCVDFAFPTLGEHAVQVDAASERAEFLLPERGVLAIEVLEADGAPLRGAAFAELRVLGATPPADRRHGCELVGGKVEVSLAASGLQLEVAVVLMDGRRIEPVVAAGPATADATAPCVLRLPKRPAFTARLLDPTGAPLANAPVVVRLEQGTSRLDAAPTTDAAGLVTFAAPLQPGGMPLPVVFAVRTAEGRQLFLNRDVELHDFAPTALGDLRLQQGVLLAAGRCLDAHGLPKVGALVFAQTETTFDQRRRPTRGAWRDLALDAVATAADGTFHLYGPPQFGRRLRLSVRGAPSLVVPFVEGAPDVVVNLPGRRRGAPMQ